MSRATPPEGHVAPCSDYGVPSQGHSGSQTSLQGHSAELCTLDADEEAVPVSAHPWEAPLLALCAAVTLLLVAVPVYAVWTVSGSWLWVLASLAVAPSVCWAVRGLRYARHRAESVKISPTQFPEAYRIVVSLSADMGLVRPPEAYVRVGEGRSGTGASGHGLRRFLVLSNDTFEVGGRLRDPDSLAFLIAHQLGHVAAGHTGYWRRLATLGAELVPGLGSALSRAMEYTADNYAYTHLPEGERAVRLFAGGKHLYGLVNMGEMADRARTDRGGLLLLYHLLSRRPSNTRRMAALRDRTRRGRVFL